MGPPHVAACVPQFAVGGLRHTDLLDLTPIARVSASVGLPRQGPGGDWTTERARDERDELYAE